MLPWNSCSTQECINNDSSSAELARPRCSNAWMKKALQLRCLYQLRWFGADISSLGHTWINKHSKHFSDPFIVKLLVNPMQAKNLYPCSWIWNYFFSRDEGICTSSSILIEIGLLQIGKTSEPITCSPDFSSIGTVEDFANVELRKTRDYCLEYDR